VPCASTVSLQLIPRPKDARLKSGTTETEKWSNHLASLSRRSLLMTCARGLRMESTEYVVIAREIEVSGKIGTEVICHWDPSTLTITVHNRAYIDEYTQK